MTTLQKLEEETINIRDIDLFIITCLIIISLKLKLYYYESYATTTVMNIHNLQKKLCLLNITY